MLEMLDIPVNLLDDLENFSGSLFEEDQDKISYW